MKALTLWPEWAHAIAHLGKRVENRNWPPPATMVGEDIAIHAGAHIGGRRGVVAMREGIEAVKSMAPVPLESDETYWPYEIAQLGPAGPLHRRLPPIRTRSIVALVRLARVEPGFAHPLDDDWRAPGARFWWHVTNVRRPLIPIHLERGSLGLWTLPADVERLVAGSEMVEVSS